jgi:predicted RNase H-like HicB family nuclease
MKKKLSLAVVLHHAQEGGYWAEAPSLPGCVSQGETLEETMANIKEAIDLWLEGVETKDLPEEMEEGKTLVVTCDVKAGKVITAA